jgi:hypothetical protein
MIKVDPDILARFDDMLKMRRVQPILRPEYRKWLRYFLDFQSKYRLSEERSIQVRLFSVP